jgi:hypothetical protein
MAKASGRRSAADKAAAAVLAKKLEPTWPLDAAEMKIWRAAIASCPPGHFVLSDAPLLTQYATIVRVFEQARRDRELGIMEKFGRLMLGFATKLRLCPHSRYDAHAAARAAKNGSEDLDNEPSWLGPKAGPRDD